MYVRLGLIKKTRYKKTQNPAETGCKQQKQGTAPSTQNHQEGGKTN